MKASPKELWETCVWLLMIQQRPLIEPPEKPEQMVRQFNRRSSVSTTSRKATKKSK